MYSLLKMSLHCPKTVALVLLQEGNIDILILDDVPFVNLFASVCGSFCDVLQNSA